MGWVLLITVYYCKSDKPRSNINRLVLVGLLTHETVLIILSIFPTLLLLFSQPSNTFALLVIHVALFYTETIAGVLVIERLNKNMWIQKLLHKCKCCTCTCKRTQRSGDFKEQGQLITETQNLYNKWHTIHKQMKKEKMEQHTIHKQEKDKLNTIVRSMQQCL